MLWTGQMGLITRRWRPFEVHAVSVLPVERPAAQGEISCPARTQPVPRDTAHGGHWWHSVTQDGV
jgi:hypothetical protein